VPGKLTAFYFSTLGNFVQANLPSRRTSGKSSGPGGNRSVDRALKLVEVSAAAGLAEIVITPGQTFSS